MIQLLRSHFVLFALDNVENPNLTKPEKDFLSGFDSGAKACTIGMSVFTADGRKLSSTGGCYQAEGVKQMLEKALRGFNPETVSAQVPPRDSFGLRQPPEGGLILYVTWKLIEDIRPEGNATSGNGKYEEVFQGSLGSDRLWVRKDEAEELAQGRFPESLKTRMLQNHVQYVLSRDVKSLNLAIHDGRIEGSLTVADGNPPAELLGFIGSKAGKISRFELLLKGWGQRVEDDGFSAGLLVVPKGKKISTALFFELADPIDGLAQVAPHRSRDPRYLK